MSKEEVKTYTPEEQLADFFKSNKTGHFNDEPDYNYNVSTGSLKLDIEMDGGPQAGVIRLTGISGGGKSACSQEIMSNFLEMHDNARGVIVPSEGKRVEHLARIQGRFECVTDYKEWKNKSCFIYRTNIFERAFTLIRDLIENNPTNTRYCFIVDSMDALIPEDDFTKSLNDATKVAGGALLSSVFLKNGSLMASARGHLIILISQVRSSIEINRYAAPDKRLSNATGGKALEHYADWILEFDDHHSKTHRIWENEAANSGKILGHNCRIIFRKSPNNKVGVSVIYPIKYLPGGIGKIWSSYEMADILVMWGQVKGSGAWVQLGEPLVKDLREAGFENVPEKVNGMKKLRQYLDDNQDVTAYLYNKFKDMALP